MNIHKEELADQLLEQRRKQEAIIAEKGKESLYIFNKYVLDVEKGKQKLAPFHKELCTFIDEDKRKKKLLLIPRGHLKSTLVTIGYSLQSIVKNPNIRILILNATWQMSVDFLTEIKNHLTTNEELIKLYGDLAADAPEWSQERILLRREDKNIKGPTVWATGIESNLVGSHPDLIIFDDVVNRDNTMTQEQIEKVKLRYKDALDLLEPGGEMIVIGTRWSMEDLYGWILDKENNIAQSYNMMVKRAYEGDLETGQDFKALWPEKFSQKELLTRLREKDWYEFSSQYLNNPIPEKDATFRRDTFKYFDMEDNRGKQMNKILTIDPAISLSKGADNTAMVGAGIDTFANLFILELVRDKLTPKQLVDKIFSLQELYHFNQVVIETIAYQKALAYYIREEQQRRNRYLPIYEINYQEQSKDQRIKGLQPLYENGKIFHNKLLKDNVFLEAELLEFPRSRHDDLIDALSMQLQFLQPPRQKVKRFQHEYLY